MRFTNQVTVISKEPESFVRRGIKFEPQFLYNNEQGSRFKFTMNWAESECGNCGTKQTYKDVRVASVIGRPEHTYRCSYCGTDLVDAYPDRYEIKVKERGRLGKFIQRLEFRLMVGFIKLTH